MNRNLIPALLVSVTVFGLMTSVHAQDPTIPFFRSLSGFGLDRTPDGVPSYGLASEDIDFQDSATPVNTGISFTNKNYDGASVSVRTSSNDFGFFAAKNFAQLSVSNVQNAGYYAIAGRGSHTTVEFFTPEALAQRAVFHWTVTGSSSTNIGTAGSRIDFAAGVYPTTDFNGFFEIPQGPRLEAYGPGSYTYNLPMVLNQPLDLFYWSSAYIEVKDSEIASVVGGSINGVANFSSTYVLDQIDLFDTNDNRITNWTMQDSATGQRVFDQNGPVGSTGNAIPEPMSVAFLLIGGTVVVVRRRLIAA
ncbi:hypothetical protein [Armatimonas sp.]|uniref:hypothetical protein n=1 Tax=Armatimonas sp. TaxID=1872638 RepID=UPI00286AF3B1|nr:hypothetical protein [Armatimonas sp.]